jgi:glutamine cyclotransferase
LVATLNDGTTTVDERMVRVLSDIDPELWIAKPVTSYPHSVTNFTQGLEFNDGILFESTGQKGQSMVAHIDMATGSSLKKMGLDANYFGEGITVFGDKVYQLTWQEQKCFIYNKNTLQIEDDIAYTGEGWGLCNDGKSLIVSNGSNQIQYWDPITFKQTKVLSVQDHTGMKNNLNELEFINGSIYANVWTTDQILKIDTATGNVTGVMNLSNLRTTYPELNAPPAEVLNGIAWDSTSKRMLITGKYWPKMFELKLN